MKLTEQLLGIDAGVLKAPTEKVTLKLAKLRQDLTFTITAIDAETQSKILEDSMTMRKGEVREFNTYNLKVFTVLKACKDLSDKELMQQFNTLTPMELVKALFLPGELDDLYNAINKLNGYEKEEEKIKN